MLDAKSVTPKRRALWAVAIVIAALEVLILVTGHRVLVWETRPSDAAPIDMPDYANLGSESIVCHYFNGRGVVFRVYYYSVNNMMGRDACPFLLDRDE